MTRLLAVPALLALLPAAPGAAQQAPPAEYVLRVTPAELVILAHAVDLAKYEFGVAAPVSVAPAADAAALLGMIMKLQAQIDAQDATGTNR